MVGSVTLSDNLIEQLKPIRELLHTQSNLVLPIVGQGVSSNLISVPNLLDHLVQRLPEESREELRSMLAKDRFLDVASALENDPRVGRTMIANAIRDHYQRPKQPAPDVYEALVALPVTQFVTTTHDPYLKNALAKRLGVAPRVYAPTDGGAFTDLLPGPNPLVLMIHGDADRPETAVLSTEAFRKLMYGNPAYRVGLQSLFAQRRLLFVGHSFCDPDIAMFIDEWQEVLQPTGGEPRHWLLTKAITPHAAASLRRRAIDPIEYGDHELLPEVFRYLATPVTHPLVLIAGPWFGMSAELREKALERWNKHAKSDPIAAHAQVRAVIDEREEVTAAQVHGILRHDWVIDLSPWRAFDRWRSRGFREQHTVKENVPAADTDAFFAGAVDAPGEEWSVCAGQLAQTLANSEFQSLVHRHKNILRAQGVLVDGFDESTLPVLQSALEQLMGAPFAVVGPTLIAPALTSLKHDVRDDAICTGIKDANWSEYRRAVRLVWGRVMKIGSRQSWPLDQAFVELMLHEEPLLMSAEVRHMVKLLPDKLAVTEDEPRALASAMDERTLRENARKQWAGKAIGTSLTSTELLARGKSNWHYVEGQAGTGKTTLMKQLCVLSIESLGSGGIGRENLVPLLVPLAGWPVDGPVAQRLMRGAFSSLTIEPSQSLREELERAVTARFAIALLDGRDELSEGKIKALDAWLNEQRAALPALIQSGRPGTRKRLGDWREIELLGLQPNRTQQFLCNYYGNVGWITQLIADLRAMGDGEAWLRIPVLLTMAAELYARDKKLANATLDLYRNSVDHLLSAAVDRHGFKGTEAKQRNRCVKPRRSACRLSLAHSARV